MPRRVLPWLLLAALAACSPAPPPPTVVNVVASASADVNAGPDGKGAPLALRVFQLASPAGFEGAQFFPLFNDPSGTLTATADKAGVMATIKPAT